MSRARQIGVVGCALAAVAVGVLAAPAAAQRRVDFHSWSAPHELRSGATHGVRLDADGRLTLAAPVGSLEYLDPARGTARAYEYGRWTSRAHRTGFRATQLVPSWNAVTPPGTWLQVDVQVRTAREWHPRWFVLGRWASGEDEIHRTSVPRQADRTARVDVDTLTTRSRHRLVAYRLRVTLLRRAGTVAAPAVSMLGAMTSALPATTRVRRSSGRRARSIELAVPRYSQSIHAGEYPEYDNGGAAWCSPTSTQMVVEYWGRRPTADQLAWVDPRYRDPQIDHAARMTYDYAYRGAGNWPFNTAYAATYGLRAYVSRLRSLRELERYVERRIPVVTSVSFRRGELPGARYGTDGHIMVVIGFTRAGDVIVNDPASPSDRAVRRVYPRHAFETVWLRTRRLLAGGRSAGGSGGVVYVISPTSSSVSSETSERSPRPADIAARVSRVAR